MKSQRRAALEAVEQKIRIEQLSVSVFAILFRTGRAPLGLFLCRAISHDFSRNVQMEVSDKSLR
jgi:hypothetical protein